LSLSPNSRSWDCSDLDATEAVAARVAQQLRPADVVYVSGEMGSGKTAFVRGACAALGVTGPVTSPTYTVGQLYRAPHTLVAHLDLYRFTGVTTEEWIDLEPYFEDTIAFVEWPEAGEGVLPAPRIRVTMRISSADARLVVVESDDTLLIASL
jgi:tRNA threonylcarbamoyladenosine biosynthesis protein TsaE